MSRWAIARLIHINGLPGMGKSSLAEEYGRRRALALVIDIDQLRTRLGHWESRPESKTLARDLAVALAAAHLGAGHDVVVPQYVGRADFVERLEVVASDAGARFIEVILVGDRTLARERFGERRVQLQLEGRAHPQADIAEAAVDSMLVAAADLLDRLCVERPTVRPVRADGGPEATYRAFLLAIGGPGD